MFLSKTPSHGDVLHATIGQKFKLYAQAKATEARYIILEKDLVLWTCNWEHVRILSCFFLSPFLKHKWLPGQWPSEHDQRVQSWWARNSWVDSELDATAQRPVPNRPGLLHCRDQSKVNALIYLMCAIISCLCMVDWPAGTILGIHVSGYIL